jgi:hypothetical protein
MLVIKMLAPITNVALVPQLYPEVPFPIKTYPGSVGENESSELLEVQTKEVEDYMDKVIRDAEKLDDFTKTEDFKKFGLLPGQQIAYGGGFGIKLLTHHGIYIGNGIVAEVASQSCLRNSLYKSKNFNTLCFGLSTMADFAKRAEQKDSPVILFRHKGYDDSDSNVIKDRLRRVKEIVTSEGNEWRQWILTHNCESAANYVSYGKMETKQGQVTFITILIAAALNGGLGGVARGYYNKSKSNDKCMEGTCMDRFVTTNGCVCESAPKYSMRYGKYCYVDSKLCKAESKRDSIGSWGIVKKGKKSMCVRKDGKNKYVSC